MKKLVSIVIVTYNSEEYIIEALDSVKAQTYTFLELIVTDDCSTDNTIALCREWIKDNKKRFIRTEIIGSERNTGIPTNINRGVKVSQGEWIKILAGDDSLLPEAIEILIADAHKDYPEERSALHGRMLINGSESEGNLLLAKWGDQKDQNFNRESTTASEQFNILLRFCPISAPTVMLKRSLLEAYGYFDERFLYWDDRPMWLRLTSNGVIFFFVDENIVNYRKHSNSVQENAIGNIFSRTQISKDEGSRVLILPHLPWLERNLCLYLIIVRKVIFNLTQNRKSYIIKVIYKGLTFFADQILFIIRKQYSP